MNCSSPGWGRRSRTSSRRSARSADHPLEGYLRLFRKAQKKVEKRQFRQRRSLMYYEKQRKKMQRQMGQDPYLDSPS